jgi:2-haloacid dehalogenase
MMYVSPSTGQEIKAVLFDTFGSVVDWRSGVARDVAAFAKRHRIELDAAVFADAWRAKYEPSMEPIRNGSREFVPLDQLHLENLHATLAEFGLNAADFDDGDLADLNAAWQRLDPWEDSVAGLVELGKHVIVGPLSNANLALLLRMALRAKLPWTVIVGSDVTRAYKPTMDAYRNMAWILRLAPGEVMLAAAHNRDLTFAQRAGLRHSIHPTSDRARPRSNEGPGGRRRLGPRLRKHPRPQQPVRRCLKPHTHSPTSDAGVCRSGARKTIDELETAAELAPRPTR